MTPVLKGANPRHKAQNSNQTPRRLMASKKAMLAVDDEDRISNLPDGVLCHILSFLPTKYSVRTRVLSTRWNLLFSFVPNLDFKYSSYGTRNSTSFIHCVNSVFTLYDVPRMNKFRLRFRLWGGKETLDHFPIDSWVSSAINHCVRQIDFEIDLGIPLTLPLHLFSCETISDLKLMGIWGRLNISIPSSVCLPCLKTCYLETIYFDDESARRLFQSCSSLEHLDLTECRVGQGVELLNISSETLKHLGIRRPKNKYKILLNVPNLLKFDYFYLEDTEIEFLGLESLKFLVDASIFSGIDTFAYFIHDSVVVELILAICHVQKLYLSGEAMEAFLRTDQQLLKFTNLTSLVFSPISSRASRLLPSLLDNTPRLESLSFYQGEEEDDFEDQDRYMLPEHVPVCVAQHLKEVEFRYLFGLDFDLKLIKYFLKYAKNLKRMKICSRSDWNEQFEINSAGCQVIFHHPWP